MAKRVFDILVSIIFGCLLSPIIIIITIMILVNLGKPIFFCQERPGLKGRTFKIIKFRTMTNEVNTNDNLTDDTKHITKFGSWLRSSSLDELPELWNVFKGDMSLVGPRPLLVEYLPLYSQKQSRRHEVRPGITGWAQVNGRNIILWEEKFEMDVWYVDNKTFLLDLKILFLTVKKVFFREGINASLNATMPRFTGSVIRQGEIIGMGAVATKDVPTGVTVVGNPAKPQGKL